MAKQSQFLPTINSCTKFCSLFSILVFMVLSACTTLSFDDSGSDASEPVKAGEDVQPSGLASTGAEYRIGPEDELEISVWGEETLQRTVLVRPDGGISFPLAGDLQAAGKTPDELRQELTQRIKKYIPEPFVTVSVAKVAGYKVYVLGQVNNPGQYLVGRYVDVLQALTLAGGLTPYASKDNITIRRRQNGKEVVMSFSYSAAQRGQNSPQNVILQSGDTVVVP